MKHWFRTQPYPFRSIQITEWILLGIAILFELPWESLPYLSELMLNESLAEPELIPFAWLWTLVCLVILGMLGLRLPAGPTLSRWIYIAVQFGVILLAITLGNWLSPFLTPYLIVVIRGYLIFGRVGRWWVTGLAFGLAIATLVIPLLDIRRFQSEIEVAADFSTAQLRTLALVNGIFGILLCILVLIYVLMLVNSILSERNSRQQLAVAHRHLQQYALRIEDQATLQERNRIAREIHDAVGHNLTTLQLQLANALLFYQSDPNKTNAHLQIAQQLATKALTEIRRSVSTLQADPLQGKSLETALQTLCCEFQAQMSGEFVYELHIATPIRSDVGATVYRLVQEALTNAIKHSQSNQVRLHVRTDSDILWVRVEDNGVGFDPTKTTTGFGLRSMRERAAALNGQLQIITASGHGCQIVATLPLARVIS